MLLFWPILCFLTLLSLGKFLNIIGILKKDILFIGNSAVPLFKALDQDPIFDDKKLIYTKNDVIQHKCGNVNSMLLASNEIYAAEFRLNFPFTLPVKNPYFQIRFRLTLVVLQGFRQKLTISQRINTDDHYTFKIEKENLIATDKDCAISTDKPMKQGLYETYELEYSVDFSKDLNIQISKIELLVKYQRADEVFAAWGIRDAEAELMTCDKSCKSCTGLLSRDCTSCYPMFESSGGTCQCSPGFSQYDLGSSGMCTDLGCSQCKPCNITCKECKGLEGAEICTSCVGADKLSPDGKCVKDTSLVEIENIFKGDAVIPAEEVNKWTISIPKASTLSQNTCGNLNVLGIFTGLTHIRWNKLIELKGFTSNSYYSVRITFILMRFGTWNETADEIFFDLNDKIILPKTVINKTLIGNCGESTQIPITYQKYVLNETLYSHDNKTIDFDIFSLSKEGSWGITQFSIFVDTCNRNCKACYGPLESNCVQCNDYNFLDSQNTCKLCPPNCLKCISNESPKTCTACDLRSYFLPNADNPELGQCQLDKCPDKMYPDDKRTCRPCAESCTTCNGPNPNNCTRCMSGLYLIEGKCESSCPATYFRNNQNPDNQVCTSCAVGCKTCLNADKTTCQSCLDTYFLKTPPTGLCEQTCPPGTFEDREMKQCQKCSIECTACTKAGPDSCSSCSENFFLEATSCKSECSVGLYGYSVTRKCLKCASYCNECTGEKATECTSCSSPYYLEANSCSSSCPTKKFGDDKDPKRSCKDCDSSCAACTGPSKNECSGCPPSFYLRKDGSCASSCLEQQFIRDAKCLDCHSSCLTCNSENKDQCIICMPGLVFYSNTCSENCPPRYFADQKLSCVHCAEGCSKCVEAADHCLACEGDFAKVKNENKCVLDCGNFFFKESNLCKDCHASCVLCSGALDSNCLSCKSENPLLFEGKCYGADLCPQGTFPNQEKKICVRCNSACRLCTSEAICQGCNKSYYLYQNSCGTCPEAYFPNESTNTCDKCNIACAKCSGKEATQCSACAAPYFLEKDTTVCVSACNTGTFGDETLRKCLKCNEKCTSCKDATSVNCDSCSRGYYLEGRTCDTTCPGNKYKDDSTNRCEKCATECKKCTGPTVDNCQECETGSFLQLPSSCVGKCKEGYFGNPSTSKCESCASACQICSDTSTKCSRCKTNYYLEGTDCKSSCSNGTYPEKEDNTCKPCNSNCLTCSGPENTKCLSCRPGLLLEEFQCKNTCSGGFYDRKDGVCAHCHSECEKCSGPSISECTSCRQGTFLEKGVCKSECADGLFKNIATNACDKCNGECKTCKGAKNTDCISCNVGTFLYRFNSTCTTQCPSGYYGVKETCEKCDPRCSLCYGPSHENCSECSSSYLLSDHTCVEACPKGKYKDSKKSTCEVCDKTCEECNDGQTDGCLKCAANLFLYKPNDIEDKDSTMKGSCLKECPWNLKAFETGRVCKKACHFTCDGLDCESPDERNCTKCANGRVPDAKKNPVGFKCICPDGFFALQDQDRLSLDPTCQKCHPSCKTCNGSKEFNCIICTDYKEFCPDKNNWENSKCCCPRGFDTGKACQDCHKSCLECAGPYKENCTKCQANIQDIVSVFQDQQAKFPKIGECRCKEGFFEEFPTCQKCDYTCKTCKSSDRLDCDDCAANRSKNKEGLCVCPLHHKNSKDPTNATCEIEDSTAECSRPCKECYVSAKSFCTACDEGKRIKSDHGTCDCPDGFYENKETSSCEKCHFSCGLCRGPGWNQCSIKCSSAVRGNKGFPDQGTCTCGEDYTENFEANCAVKTETEKNLRSTFSASTISSAVTMSVVGSGISTVIAYRFVETCQLLSFMKYINIQYPLNFESYLNLLSKFNIDRIFSNPGMNMASMAQQNKPNGTAGPGDSGAASNQSQSNATAGPNNSNSSAPGTNQSQPENPPQRILGARELEPTNISNQVPSQKFYLDDLSSSFLYNALPLIIILASCLAFTLLLYLIGEVIITNPLLFIAKLSRFVRWGLFLRVYQMLFLQLNLYIFLQLKSFSASSSFNIASLVLTIIVLVVEAGILTLIVYTLNCSNLDDMEISWRYESLWDGVDTIYMSRRNYTSLNMVRKLLTVIVLVYAFDTPRIQVVFIFVINLLFLLYVAFIRPFKIIFEWVYNLIIESIISLFLLLALIYVLVEDNNYKLVFGWFLISLMIFLMISALVFTVYVLIKVCYRSWGTIKKRIRQKTIFNPSLEHSMTMGSERALENPMKTLLQSNVIFGESPDVVLFSKKEQDEKYREKNIRRMMEERNQKEVEMKSLEKYKSEEEPMERMSPKNINIVVQDHKTEGVIIERAFEDDEREGDKPQKTFQGNKLQVTGKHQRNAIPSHDVSIDLSRHHSEPANNQSPDGREKPGKSKSAEVKKLQFDQPFEAIIIKENVHQPGFPDFKKGEKVTVMKLDVPNDVAEVRRSNGSTGKVSIHDVGIAE